MLCPCTDLTGELFEKRRIGTHLEAGDFSASEFTGRRWPAEDPRRGQTCAQRPPAGGMVQMTVESYEIL